MPSSLSQRARAPIAAVLLALGSAGVAHAALVTFTGSQMNVDPASGPAAARCGGEVTVNIGNGPGATSTGTSNFGHFLSTQSHCIAPPPPTPYDQGLFTYDFAVGDSLYGVYDGVLTFNSPGLFDNLQNLTVTGGTGRFVGATGTFTGHGVVDFRGPTPAANLDFSGEINTPAIPEPGTWALLIAGFGLAGTALRRQAWRRLLA